ncbi:MAG: Uma2 family endonuclease [Archangium sp.]|nr:Uma2 family endonuclease [Archangium sp.]MDP3575893.1 Uma2 family endonuclease [Archangium sp.]
MSERGKHHTIEEWLQQPPDRRLELVDGEFIEKALPDVPHALAQAGTLALVHPLFHRKPGGSGPGPGGWWILSEVDLQLGANGYRPDLAGWRRERAPLPPPGRPVILRPDWICEVLSESNRHNDTIRKLRRYHEAGVPHYWLLDPETGTLTVFRHEPLGYLNVLIAERPQRVRAEPFEAIEVHVGALLGDDPE